MTTRYQIEALLRPPVELWSALLSVLMVFLLLQTHEYLWLSHDLALAGGILFSGHALLRLGQGLRIRRYQKRLKKQPRYSRRANRIPCSRQKLFVGRGFQWTSKHTQRLRDCLLPENSRVLREPIRYRVIRSLRRGLDRIGIHDGERNIRGNYRVKGWRRVFRPVAMIRNALGRFLQSERFWNPLRLPPEVGGRPEIHGVGLWEGEKNILAPLGERVGHTLVLGTTRVGKTRLAEVLISQDIRRGDTVIVFDPKGDSDLMRGMYSACRKAGRLDRFTVFHLAYPEYSSRYNPISSYSRITQVATRIANALPGEGNSAAFREFAWRFSNVIAQALQVLGEVPTYRAITQHVTSIDGLLIRYGRRWLDEHGPEDWEAALHRYEEVLTMPRDDPDRPRGLQSLSPSEKSRDLKAVSVARLMTEILQHEGRSDPVGEGLLSAFKYERAYFDKIVSSLGPFLEKMCTGEVAELFSPFYHEDESRPVFDWMSVIRENSVVYVGLAALQDPVVASAVGNSMFSDLTSLAGEVYAHGAHANIPGGEKARLAPVSLHADEFNELIGDEFIPLLNKAGGAGFQVTAYTQTWADVEARIGDRAKASQIEGNFNTLFMMRVRSRETAELLCDMLPDVQISHVTSVSTAQQSSDPGSAVHFGSSIQDRVTTADVPMLQSGDLTRLPKGHAFLLMQGGQLFKLRIPLPKAERGRVPKEIRELTRQMTQDTGVVGIRPDPWWARLTSWWSGRKRAREADLEVAEKIREMMCLSEDPEEPDPAPPPGIEESEHREEEDEGIRPDPGSPPDLEGPVAQEAGTGTDASEDPEEPDREPLSGAETHEVEVEEAVS